MGSSIHFKNIISLSLALLLAGTSWVAHAGNSEDIAAIKLKLENRTPPVKAKSIKASAIPGLYEVFVGGNLIYTDSTFSYAIMNGTMIDISSKKNLTEESYKQLTTIKFVDLPLQNAIEIKRGSGAYKFAVFSDPDCPYCKSLESGLAKSDISDFTAYIFIYPLKDLHPDAAAKSESIWCAKDRAEAWTNYMVKGIAPEKLTCDNPITANEKLAEELGVGGTPTIYLSDGQLTQNPQELVALIKAKK